MKKAKGKLIGGTLLGPSPEEKLANFINENKLKKEDIIQIVHNTSAGYAIFYYVDENQE